jgi:hypothetical protein
LFLYLVLACLHVSDLGFRCRKLGDARTDFLSIEIEEGCIGEDFITSFNCVFVDDMLIFFGTKERDLGLNQVGMR